MLLKHGLICSESAERLLFSPGVQTIATRLGVGYRTWKSHSDSDAREGTCQKGRGQREGRTMWSLKRVGEQYPVTYDSRSSTHLGTHLPMAEQSDIVCIERWVTDCAKSDFALVHERTMRSSGNA